MALLEKCLDEGEVRMRHRRNAFRCANIEALEYTAQSSDI